jgi:hypothetical protein
MELFTDRHAGKIRGDLSCFDRVVITGTIPVICYAAGMTVFLRAQGVRIFDYPKWAEPLREEIRSNAERLAEENGLQIDFIRKNNFRKEARIKEIVSQRGDHPGLVHIFSAMEPCGSYKPWHDKKTGQTFLRPVDAKCLHYYFYFIDPDLGLCYLRVPTWAPFRLQFYYNGHHQLAIALGKNGLDYEMLDNSFISVEDWDEAQALADQIDPKAIHEKLNLIADRYCPVIRRFEDGYHWSLMQVEYATDIVFFRQSDLAPIYEELVRTAIHTIKPDHIATFLGRKLTSQYQDELGNHFHTRIEGTRIKHHMGKTAVKMYDKHGIILRIETVTNDVTFFKHHRRVEHRNGTATMKTAPLKKSIYSLSLLADLMWAANRRYLQFISAIDDPTSSLKNLDKISRPARHGKKTFRGFNLFHGEDLKLFQVIFRGEFNISGFHNRDLQPHLPGKTPHQISRLLKRLRKHSLIRKVAKTYKYYLTKLGRSVVAAALKLREMCIIPSLRAAIHG